MKRTSRVQASNAGRIFRLVALGALGALGLGGLAGCEDKPVVVVNSVSSALIPAKPAPMGAVKLIVDRAPSKVDFMMEAPKEKIHGKVADATSGELNVDPSDLTKSTGLLTIDISGLEIFQALSDDKDKDGKFSEEKKSDLQNKHARTWLEIADDAPAKERAENAKVQFSIKSIDVTGEKSLAKMTGPERKVTLMAKGDFLLHGHKAEKTAALDATFKFDGDKLVSVAVKSAKPITVDLAEFDVKPRDAFGRFAAKTLEALSPKVNKEALVSVDFSAKASP
jgi:hypothetical protein